MKSNSWVIVRKNTGEAILETWNEKALKHLKSEFEAVPTYDYLVNINKKIMKEHAKWIK
jgi:coenzyme F420-reducing hydrogenase beta subunit